MPNSRRDRERRPVDGRHFVSPCQSSSSSPLVSMDDPEELVIEMLKRVPLVGQQQRIDCE